MSRVTLLLTLALPGALAAQTYTRVSPRTAPPTAPTATTGATATLSPTRVDDMPAPVAHVRDATPSSATLGWEPLPAASGFLVFRNDLGQLTPGPLPAGATSYSHVAQNDHRMTYQYRVVALYPNSHTGPGAPVSFTPPKPVNPAGFSATVKGTTATLTWQAVPGVERYLLGGARLGLNGMYLSPATTSFEVRDLAAGRHEWVIASRYPAGVETHYTEWSKTVATVVVASGTYRLTLAGFVVERETGDGPHNGHNDEIFAATMVQHFDRTDSRVIESDLVRSRTQGDVNNHPERIRQGRGSETGGLTTADVVPGGWDQRSTLPVGGPQQFPLVLWEGVLADGQDVIVLRPTLWEEEGEPVSFQDWREEVAASAPSTIASPDVQNALKGSAIAQLLGAGLSYSYASAWDELRYVGRFRHQVRAGHDRPIGMNYRSGGKTYFRDLMVVLTREQIEGELNRPNTTARGLVPIRFTDTVEGGAAYTLYLRLERVP